MNRLRFLVICLLGPGMAVAACEKISLPLGAGLTRADIYIIPASGHSAGTLILCPGHNGNGGEMVAEADWSDFARKQNLNLVGLSFASNDDPQDHGYFKAEEGSGDVLLKGLKQAFGAKTGPLLLYGFSRGAEFVDTFTRWKPDFILTWCAYSATEWEISKAEAYEPCGIIACGDEDEPNYSSAVYQFLRGRSIGMRWTWVSLAHTGHCRSAALEAFVRNYFASVLMNPRTTGLWLDVDTKNPPAPAEIKAHPTLADWLPDKTVARLWGNLHQP